MDSNDSPRPPASFLPIAQVAPTFERLEEHSIRAVVTLVWPYSSATKSLSLLLAEPDFRLRRSSGQVKVAFHGCVAEKVAKTHVGIGDEVALNLAGSRLVENGAAASGVAWDVHFDDRVFLEITRASKLLSFVQVESPTEPQPADEDAVPPSTPQNVGIRVGGTDPTGLGTWESPAFSQLSRTSFGPLVDTAFDPFAEEDGFVPGKGRKRPRFSMRSSEWRVVDEPESPQEKEAPGDWIDIMLDAEVSEPEIEEKDTAEDVEATEAPVVVSPVQDTRDASGFIEHYVTVPSIQLPPELDGTGHTSLEQLAEHATQSAEAEAGHNLEPGNQARANGIFDHLIHLPTDTPRLHPVPSPGLPIPSPIVSSNNPNGYFTSFATTTTQVPHGRSVTTETQTVAKAEGSVGSQMQPMAPQAQRAPSLDVEMRNEEGPSFGDQPVQQALGIDFQESSPTNVNQRTKTLHPTNIQHEKDTEPTPGSDEDDQDVPVEHTAEFLEMESAVDEREGDLDEEYSEDEVAEGEDLQPKGEWSDEDESEEEVDEHGLEDTHQGLRSKDPYDKGQAEFVNLDSDESEEQGHSNFDIPTAEVHSYSPMEEALNGRGDYVEYEKGGKGIDDDMEEEEVEGDIDEQVDEEEANSEGMENDYESEGEPRGSDLESAGVSEEDEHQQPPLPKNEPDVIVLDSDSDEEPQPRARMQLAERPGHEAPQQEGLQQFKAEAGSDEYSNFMDSAEEDLARGNGELSVDEQSEEENEEDELKDVDMDENVEDVGGTWEDSATAPAPYVSTADIQKKPTSVGEAEIHGTRDSPVSEAAYENDYAIDPSAQSSDGGPDSTTGGVDLAIDSSSVVFQGNAEETARKPARQVMDHVEIRRRPEQSPEASEAVGPSDKPIWLDGAASPAPVSDSKIHLLPTVREHPMTPGGTQEVGVDYQPFRDATLNGVPPTPQYSQEAILDSAVQHQIHMSTTPSIDAPIESDAEPSSPVPQERGVREPSPSEYLEAQERPDDGFPHGETGRRATPEASERYFSPTEPEPDTATLHRKIHVVPLAALGDHSNALVDTISVVCEVSPSDLGLTAQITDPSMAGASLPAEIPRPDKETLVSLGEGDGLLLRNFKVQSSNSFTSLVTADTSSWTIFNDSTHSAQPGSTAAHNTEERAHATEIQQWYRELGAAMVADNQLQASIGMEAMEETPETSGVVSDEESYGSGVPDARDDSPSSVPRSVRRRRKHHRKITVHELRDGRRYAQVGSPSGREGIHQLRDGTVYANL